MFLYFLIERELISLWSKLQRRLDPSLTSLRERCLQLGAIAKTVQHLLYLVRVIQAEVRSPLFTCALQARRIKQGQRSQICRFTYIRLNTVTTVLKEMLIEIHFYYVFLFCILLSLKFHSSMAYTRYCDLLFLLFKM